MAITFTVEFAGEAGARLSRLAAGLGDGQGLHDSMAMGVEHALRSHLESAGYVGRVNRLGGQTTGFWKQASNSVSSVAGESEATVSMPHRGAALRYFGGPVVPLPPKKALSVPVHPSGHGVYARQYPGTLAFIPAGRAFGPMRSPTAERDDFVGFLVRGEEYVRTRGPNKGQPGVRPLPGGETIYILMLKTHHKPDPNVLPSQGAMRQAAADAGEAYLEAVTN